MTEMSPLRLLILDDDPAIGATITMMAAASQVDCRFTSAADDFFRQVETWRPTHIAIDLVMPGQDGIQVLQQLAERGCDAAIIITSGVDSRVLEAAHRSAKEHGLRVAGAIAKPFSLTTLRGLLSGPGASPVPLKAELDSALSPPTITAEMLSDAIAHNQLSVAFQPKVSCAHGQLAGFEALARWRHPDQGAIAPVQFIAAAEQLGVIDELTEKIVSMALSEFGYHSRSGLSLALNVSASSLSNPDFADRLADLCEQQSVNPASVIVEVTESSAMSDQTTALDLLTRLRLKGFQLSIDDFGVGHSSLLQLARMPFSELKIDRSFVMSAMHSLESRTIIGAIAGLARSLGLRTVAEGVEDLSTFGFLKEAGCDLAQGYFIARPMPADAIARWMGEPVSKMSAAG